MVSMKAVLRIMFGFGVRVQSRFEFIFSLGVKFRFSSKVRIVFSIKIGFRIRIRSNDKGMVMFRVSVINQSLL